MCWWMMSWIVAQATQQEKIKFLYQDQIHKLLATSPDALPLSHWVSFLYYRICIICHMVLHVHVHPLNFAFDSSKINGYAFTIVHYLKCII